MGYRISLNAKEYTLRYTLRDGIQIRKRLARGGGDVIASLLGSDTSGKNVVVFNQDVEALAICIVEGIRQEQKVSEDVILRWLQEYVDNGHDIQELIRDVVRSLVEDGAFGPRMKMAEPEPEAMSGKDPTEETSPT